jgi:hypothetical protein
MARRIHDAVAMGSEWLVTETGEDLPERPNPSFRNMMRAGFLVAYQRRNYLRPRCDRPVNVVREAPSFG